LIADYRDPAAAIIAVPAGQRLEGVRRSNTS